MYVKAKMIVLFSSVVISNEIIIIGVIMILTRRIEKENKSDSYDHDYYDENDNNGRSHMT